MPAGTGSVICNASTCHARQLANAEEQRPPDNYINSATCDRRSSFVHCFFKMIKED